MSCEKDNKWIKLESWENKGLMNFSDGNLIIASEDWRVVVKDVEKERYEDIIDYFESDKYPTDMNPELLEFARFIRNNEVEEFGNVPSKLPGFREILPLKCEKCGQTHSEFKPKIKQESPFFDATCSKCSSNFLIDVSFCTSCQSFSYHMYKINKDGHREKKTCTKCLTEKSSCTQKKINRIFNDS